jgi:aquaporin Z
MAAAIISFGHITNGYFNPAFSLGMAVAGRLKFSAMALYMVAQTVGAVLASAVWLAMMQVMPSGATPETPALFGALANGFDAHSPSQVPMIGVLIVEIVAVAVLTAMVLGVTSARNKTTLGPVAIGVAFAVAVGITMPLSNGSLNPARATSVVFLADSWAAGQLWLFWLGPLVGAALAAAIFRSFSSHVPAGLETGTSLADDGATAGPVASEAGADDEGAEAVVAPAAPVPASSIDSGRTGGANDAQAFFDGTRK